MANWYVWSGATGAGTGADWTNAYTTLNAATTAKAAGDVFYVAHDHVQTTASALTITFAGSDANPNRVYCVNRAGSVPPVAADLRTTAQISTTGASNMTFAGTAIEIYGIIFSAGDGANAASFLICSTTNRMIRFNACALRLSGGSSTSRMNFGTGAGSALVVLENTTVQFSNASQGMVGTGGRCIWRNTPSAITGATLPSNLLNFGTGSWFLEGVDLSVLASGKSIVNVNSGNPNLWAVLKDCKLGSAVTVATTVYSSTGGPETTLIRSDSTNTNYRAEKYTYAGTQTIETTIVRTGGASDGTTAISWKIVTSANSKWETPFECLPITIWNDTSGSSKTVTVQGIWGTGALPKNDDIWIDVEYSGDASFPIGSKATSTRGVLATNADVAAGSGTWGGSTTSFALAVTFTPLLKGPFTIYVKAAKVSTTFYIDPKPVIT